MNDARAHWFLKYIQIGWQSKWQRKLMSVWNYLNEDNYKYSNKNSNYRHIILIKITNAGTL